MIKVNKERLIKELHLVPSGMRGWFDGKCAFCGREMKMGVRLYNEHGGEPKFIGYNCFSAKCGKSGGVLELLKQVGRLDLASVHQTMEDRVDISASSIISDLNSKIVNLDTSTKEIKPPMGFSPVALHPYLKKRGFTKEQYSILPVGLTSLHPKFKRKKIYVVGNDGKRRSVYNEYIVALVINDGVCKGYLGRSMLDDDIIKSNNENVKRFAKDDPDYRRYMIHKYINSVSDFGKLLLGYDEIVAGVTKTVVLVEGWFDKSNTDNKMGYYKSDDTKVVASFGKDLSEFQMAMLLMKGVENLIIMYDPDALAYSKELSIRASRYFKIVRVAVLHDKDPGVMTGMDFQRVMKQLRTPIQMSRVIV